MADVKPDAGNGGGEAAATITLRVKDQTGEETLFKVKRSTRMEKVMATYASRKGVNADSLRFLIDGQRINAHDTPEQLDLEDDDQIDVMLEQLGGASR